jgi:hypothetical protein
MEKEKLERMINHLKDAMDFFCNIQVADTKEEAFLKGYMMGLGSSNKYTPNFELMLKNPQMMIPIEQEIMEINSRVTKDFEVVARKVLMEWYDKEKKPYPDWLVGA